MNYIVILILQSLLQRGFRGDKIRYEAKIEAWFIKSKDTQAYYVRFTGGGENNVPTIIPTPQARVAEVVIYSNYVIGVRHPPLSHEGLNFLSNFGRLINKPRDYDRN